MPKILRIIKKVFFGFMPGFCRILKRRVLPAMLACLMLFNIAAEGEYIHFNVYAAEKSSCNHVYESRYTGEPNCSSYVEEIFTCIYCGDTLPERNKIQLDHVIEILVQEPVNCITDGFDITRCKVCGLEISRKVIKNGDLHVFDSSGGKCTLCGYTKPGYTPTCVNHNYDKGVVIQKGDCIKPEVKKYTCTVCGHSYDETLHLTHIHVYNTTEPTCKSAGVREETCSRCGKIFSTTTLPKLTTHTYKTTITVRETATSGGIKTLTCTVCGATKTEEIPKSTCTNHQYGKGVITTEPTCGKAGIMTYTCQICSNQKTEELPNSNGHQFGTGVITISATCASQGERSFTCVYCGEKKTESITKSNKHSWNTGIITKPATVNEKGIKTYTCIVCGKEKTEDIPKIVCAKHDYGTGVETTKATCGKTGVRTFVCSVCRDIKTEIIPKLMNHSYDNGEITKEATCADFGEMTYTCQICGITKTENIDKLTDHEYDEGKVTKKATATEFGEAIHTCLVCGDTFTEVLPVIPCKNHNYDEGAITKLPTCNETGERTYTCTDCHEMKTVTIAKIPEHYYSEGQISVYPTCGSDGERTYICKICGDRKTESIEKTSEHIYNRGIVVKAPTVLATGIKEYTCLICPDKYTEEIPTLECEDHRYDNGLVTTEATCTEAGTKTYTCTICFNVKTENIAKLSHVYEWKVTKEPTESEAGERKSTCVNCGNVEKTETIDALGGVPDCQHTSKHLEVVTPATCISKKIANSVCNNCGEIVYANRAVANSIDPNNHVNTKVTQKDATYTTEGYRKVTCLDCGVVVSNEVIPVVICNHPKTDTIWVPNESGKNDLWKRCAECKSLLEKLEGLINACTHKYQEKPVLNIQATATEWGEIGYNCSKCGKQMRTEAVHPYDTYTVVVDGVTNTYYGYFDEDMAREIATLTSDYRQSYGLNGLAYNTHLQWASNQRALEIMAYPEHERPDGSHRSTLTSEWRYGGENLCTGGIATAQRAMTLWKESDGHNENLLHNYYSGNSPFRGISCGVFVRYIFYENSSNPYKPLITRSCVQNFTF